MDQNSDLVSDNFESFFRKHDAVFLLMNGETGQLIDANDAALRFYGYSLKQIRSMKIGDINKLPHDQLEAERQRAVKEKRKYFIVPHRLANGEIRLVEVHTTPIGLKDKKYLFSVIHDITDRRKAKEELLKNKAMLENAQELGHMGSWDWDITTNELIWSDEVYKIYGLDPKKDKPDYKIVIDTLTPECRNDFQKAIEDTLKRKKPFDGEYCIICPDGTKKYTHTKGQVIRDKNGNPARMFGMVQDITEMKLAEKELSQFEIKLKAVVESTADGILAVDNKGKVINANQRFMNMWKIPKSLMDTGDDSILLSFVLKQLVDPDAFLRKVKLLYNTDREDMDTLYFKDSRIFERFSFPLKMDGNIIGRVWSFRDITERKKSEESLQFQAKILENMAEGVTLIDEKGNICFTNDKFDKMFGYKKGELAGKNIAILKAYSKKENKKFVKNIFRCLKIKKKMVRRSFKPEKRR